MTSLKTGNEEDEQINRVKENDLDGRDVWYNLLDIQGETHSKKLAV